MSVLTIKESWPCWQWQVEFTKAFYSQDLRDGGRGVNDSGLRNFVAVIARQAGKTVLAQSILQKEARERPGNYWFVAPTYDRSEEVYEQLVSALRGLIEKRLATPKQTKAGWRIKFSRNYTWKSRPSAIHFKSLANPEMLRGPTLRGIVHDESQNIEGKYWRTILQPMLRIRDGWAVFVGTPPDPDEAPDPLFLYQLHQRGQGGDPKWFSMSRDYTCIPDPRVRADIEADRPHIPADEFAREYLCKFTHMDEIGLPAPREWGPGTDVVRIPSEFWTGTGVDLADSDKELGHKAAVVTYKVGPQGRVYVVAAEYYRNPSEVLDALYIHWRSYGTKEIKLQSTAFDKGFRHTVEAAAASRGSLPLTMTDIGGASKRRRILQLEPIARQGNFYIHSSLREFRREWDMFPQNLEARGGARRRMGHHYDMLDAVAVCAEDARRFWESVPVEPRKVNSFAAYREAMRLQHRGYSRQHLEEVFIP